MQQRSVIRRTAILALMLLSSWTLGAANIDIAPTSKAQRNEIQQTAFVQSRTIKGMSRPLKSQGHLLLIPNAGLLYQLEQPISASYLMGQQALVIAEAGQVKRVSADEAPWLRAMSSLLPQLIRGDIQALAESFSLEAVSVSSGYHWRCIPKDSVFKKALPQIELIGDQYVQQVRYQDGNGGVTELHLSSPTTAMLNASQQHLLETLKP